MPSTGTRAALTPCSNIILYDASMRDIIIGDAKIIIITPQRSVFDVVGRYRLEAAGARDKHHIHCLRRPWDLTLLLYYYFILCACTIYIYIIYNIISCYLSLANVTALAHYFGRECVRTASVCERHVQRRRRLRSYCSY